MSQNKNVSKGSGMSFYHNLITDINRKKTYIIDISPTYRFDTDNFQIDNKKELMSK